jgi:hypothetical protein
MKVHHLRMHTITAFIQDENYNPVASLDDEPSYNKYFEDQTIKMVF